MEKLQYRLRITAQRDWDMVCQQQDILRMESFWTEFSPMDLWETLVVPDTYIFFTDTDGLSFPLS